MLSHNPNLSLVIAQVDSINRNHSSLRFSTELIADKNWLSLTVTDPVSGKVFGRKGPTFKAALESLFALARQVEADHKQTVANLLEVEKAGVEVRHLMQEGPRESLASLLLSEATTLEHGFAVADTLMLSVAGNALMMRDPLLLSGATTSEDDFAVEDTLMLSVAGNSPTVSTDAVSEHSDP